MVYNEHQVELDNNQKLNNINVAAYLNKTQNEDEMLANFTNAFYKKIKKIFLLQTQIKSANFIPTTEINERQKLFN